MKEILANSLLVEDICRRIFLFDFDKKNLDEILNISINLDEIYKTHPFINDLQKAKIQEFLDEARWEFNRLFVGPARPKAVPYESVYFDYHNMFGEKTMQVRDFYERAGLRVKKFDKFPDDFIGYEFEYLYFMSYKALNDEDDFAKIIQEKKSFLELHPSQWFDKFIELCIKESKLEIWKNLAEFLKLYLKNEIEILNKILKNKKDLKCSKKFGDG
ncbi:molecular chaperone TorD family protein [Campylobacter sp. RM12327]|uniref:TorD/DmsD family molecular chaperone n=1 Tax=Campylobacter sputorum TaxID=206 RepID=UPI000B78DA4A|nr:MULTISPECIES: molecular chaperone TorD family protein [Campylobacter]ASM40061.1 reductase assembly protein [Campylobacter sputorum]MBE7358180.1 molecular chaperone TorD family protein [Campylobacter sp. RM11302]MBF6669434.1 molecular chaperone TorD family protein [Campylobacter sp. RM12327]MBF6674439.1 molecular chaperone TorD family protein [Campylobacter sp. RM13538]MBF6676189.1 molecular chaperone TorD family protein [Campylobacter sp. RM12321]